MDKRTAEMIDAAFEEFNGVFAKIGDAESFKLRLGEGFATLRLLCRNDVGALSARCVMERDPKDIPQAIEDRPLLARPPSTIFIG